LFDRLTTKETAMTPEQIRIVQAKKDAWASVDGTRATILREAARESSGNAQGRAETKPTTGNAKLVMASSHAPKGAPGHMRTITVVSVLALAAAAGLGYAATVDLGADLMATIARSHHLPVAAGPRAGTDHTRFLLNALLVPALDTDALPLRWTDPRGPSQCGPNTTVRVNGVPLVAGALVPNQPFELEWQANACRPFGKAGPRYDGRVKLTVYREDWGFSATVEPVRLRLTSVHNVSTLMQPGAVSLPPQGDSDTSVTLTAACEAGAPPCL
jgi:hypothetical protein